MKIDFTNKTVVVTGGTRGVGAAIVQLFQECNAEIIATGTNLDNLKRLMKNRQIKEQNIRILILFQMTLCKTFWGI